MLFPTSRSRTGRLAFFEAAVSSLRTNRPLGEIGPSPVGRTQPSSTPLTVWVPTSLHSQPATCSGKVITFALVRTPSATMSDGR